MRLWGNSYLNLCLNDMDSRSDRTFILWYKPLKPQNQRFQEYLYRLGIYPSRVYVYLPGHFLWQ